MDRPPPNDARFAARLTDEPARVRALQRSGLVDRPSEGQFDAITALVRDVLGVPICAVTLIDSDQQFCNAAVGMETVSVPRSDAFCDHTIRIRGVTVVEDATCDPRFQANPMVVGAPYIRSYAGAPLVMPDHYQIGALCVVDTRPRTFSDEQLKILQGFAAVVVDAIELRTQAQQDYLTRTLSRRGFAAEVEMVFERHARDGQPAALITIDLDHFKAINDRLGHAAGDAVLRAVARAMRGTLRRHQPIGRLGGEEFGVLLPGAGVAEAMICAERLRGTIATLDIDGISGVTASFGIAALEAGDSIARWTEASDRALYVAKRSGRNRCAVASLDGDEDADFAEPVMQPARG